MKGYMLTRVGLKTHFPSWPSDWANFAACLISSAGNPLRSSSFSIIKLKPLVSLRTFWSNLTERDDKDWLIWVSLFIPPSSRLAPDLTNLLYVSSSNLFCSIFKFKSDFDWWTASTLSNNPLFKRILIPWSDNLGLISTASWSMSSFVLEPRRLKNTFETLSKIFPVLSSSTIVFSKEGVSSFNVIFSMSLSCSCMPASKAGA